MAFLLFLKKMIRLLKIEVPRTVHNESKIVVITGSFNYGSVCRNTVWSQIWRRFILEYCIVESIFSYHVGGPTEVGVILNIAFLWDVQAVQNYFLFPCIMWLHVDKFWFQLQCEGGNLERWICWIAEMVNVRRG